MSPRLLSLLTVTPIIVTNRDNLDFQAICFNTRLRPTNTTVTIGVAAVA